MIKFSDIMSMHAKTCKRDFDYKHATVCRLCMGKSCRHCGLKSFTRHHKLPAIINGLHADYCGPEKNILACQRPSTRVNNEYDVVMQFKEYAHCT